MLFKIKVTFAALNACEHTCKNKEVVTHFYSHARAHVHTGSNPVVCAELFSVTGLHCSAVMSATRVPDVKGHISPLRSTLSYSLTL